MLRPHIVILGAGFGGTYVGKRLARLAKRGEIELTIVNRTNYFLFTPLLHEVATGSLSPRSVAEPLREIFVGTRARIIQGVVDTIDLETQTVKIANGPAIEYDYLVIATGAETNYYGIPGAERLALPLKTIADAARIRNRVIDAFEAASLTTDTAERARLLSFAVVGGGPTGVEVASELAELVSGMIKRYFSCPPDADPDDPGHCLPEEPVITLLDTGPEILSMYDPELRRKAAERLTKDGVAIKQNTKVVEVAAQGITLGDGSMLVAGTVIWAAGVKPTIPRFENAQPELIAGRLAVNDRFQLKGQTRVFVLGDAAGYIDPRDQAASDVPGAAPARPVPQLAQAAVSEARAVAGNIVASIAGKELQDFHFNTKGSMVSVGQWFAIGRIFSVNMSGPLTWWLWRTVYLFKFASWRKRAVIAFEWAFELILPRDITKL